MADSRRFEVQVIVWGFALNLIWELAQSPLYADHANGGRYIAWTRIHCALGDVLILLGSFWATAAAYRSWHWPVTRGLDAAAVFLGFGLAYTAWSEWFNVTVREAWTYSPAMPRIFGIGLSPLLQWLVLPAVLVGAIRLSEARKRNPEP